MRNLRGWLAVLLVQGFAWSAFPQTPAADSFNPVVNGRVSCFCIQPDGRVILAGAFSRVGGLMRSNIARVFADGGVDETFNPGANGDISTLALQPDGNILVGGNFSVIGGQERTNIARLNSDGKVDKSFRGWANGPVLTIAPQPDGKILIGGLFEMVTGPYGKSYGARLDANGEMNIARLHSPGTATQDLRFNGATVTWLRGGTSPEVWRTTFEYDPDGYGWTKLGFAQIFQEGCEDLY